MSGGAFDYKQNCLGDIADMIHDHVNMNEYSPEAKFYLEETIRCLMLCQIMVTRADWFMSGDDSEKTYLERLTVDLALDKIYENACMGCVKETAFTILLPDGTKIPACKDCRPEEYKQWQSQTFQK